MPNWCDTTYKCVGDPKEVRALHKILKYIDRRKTTIVRNGFGKWWLGNLVTKHGGKWEDYRCRGEIIDYSFDGDILSKAFSTDLGSPKLVKSAEEKIVPLQHFLTLLNILSSIDCILYDIAFCRKYNLFCDI